MFSLKKICLTILLAILSHGAALAQFAPPSKKPDIKEYTEPIKITDTQYLVVKASGELGIAEDENYRWNFIATIPANRPEISNTFVDNVTIQTADNTKYLSVSEGLLTLSTSNFNWGRETVRVIEGGGTKLKSLTVSYTSGKNNLNDLAMNLMPQLSMLGTTQPFGDVYGKTKIIKQGTLCVAQGLVKKIDVNKPFVQFPETYRPPGALSFCLNNHDTTYKANLAQDGTLDVITNHSSKDGGATFVRNPLQYDWLSLSGMIFSTTPGKPIPLNGSSANKWQPASTPQAGPAYNKEGNIVVLSGVIKGTRARTRPAKGSPAYSFSRLSGVIIGTLPEEARPTTNLIFNIQNTNDVNTKNSRLDISTSGKILYTGEEVIDISFAGIAFSTAPIKTTLTLENTWAQYYPESWGPVSIFKEGKIVMLQGLVKSNPLISKPGNQFFIKIAQLPKNGYAPSQRLVFNSNRFGNNIRIDVTPDGGVYWVGGGDNAPDWISLSNIIYAVE